MRRITRARASKGQNEPRRVRFVTENDADEKDTFHGPPRSSNGAPTSPPQSLKTRRRLSLPLSFSQNSVLPVAAGCTRPYSVKLKQKWNRRGRAGGQKAAGTTDFLLAADEIERILRDETSSTNAANQMFDRDDECQNPATAVGSSSSSINGSSTQFRRRISSSLPRRLRQSFTEITAETGPSSACTVSPSMMAAASSSDELTEHDVNAYGLFESAGADEARFRQEQRRRHRSRQQERNANVSASESASSLPLSLLTTNRHDRENRPSLFASFRSLFPNDDDDDDDDDRDGGGEYDRTSSSQTGVRSIRGGNSDGVIYDLKKYGTAIPFFTPILVILTTLFCALVVLRLLVSLLTVAVGWVVVILLSGRLIHALFHRPLQLGRLVHSRPIPAWAFLGGLWGMASVCLTRVLILLGTVPMTYQKTSMHLLMLWAAAYQATSIANATTDSGSGTIVGGSITTMGTMYGVVEKEDYGFCYGYEQDADNDPVNQFLGTLLCTATCCTEKGFCCTSSLEQLQHVSVPLVLEPTSCWSYLFSLSLPSSSSIFSMRQDLVLIWGLVEGILYGVQVGVLWFLVLGHASRPSQLSRWMYVNIWRFAKRQYRQCIRQRLQARLVQTLRRQQRQQLLRRRSEGCIHNNANKNSWATNVDDHRKQCMICLEDFLEDDGDGGDNDHGVSSLYQRHYLLCRHSFHSCCIQEWLEINASCPICRIPLEEAIAGGGGDDGEGASHTRTRLSPSLEEPT